MNLYTRSMKILFIIYCIFNLLFLPIDLSTIYGTLFLACLFYQDYKTMYIHPIWLIFTILFYAVCKDYVELKNSLLTGFFYLSVCGGMKCLKKDWIGSADVYFLFFFGFFLGFERMFIALQISVLIGFFWMFFLKIQKKECICPYISCLCIGVYVAWIKGYTIFYWLCNCIKF